MENCERPSNCAILSDWELVVEVTGTLSNHAIYIDSIYLVDALWAGGVSYGILPGSTQFLKGDRFTVPLSNDNAGVFQTYMRKGPQVQLRSSATPSIDDELAY